MKPAEDGSGDVVLRLYEAKHGDTTAVLTVHLPVAEAWLCDLLENPTEPLAVTGAEMRLHLRPFEVKTVRLKVRP